MINLKDIVSCYKGDYIHALFYFLKNNLYLRNCSVSDLDYDEFYFDVNSVFSLDDLRGFCFLISSDNSTLSFSSIYLFFEELGLQYSNILNINGGV